MASTTTGSNVGVCDDVTASRGSRARRPRIYDWNTKQHFYPDIIDSDEWTRQFVRRNSARWRSSGRHQAAAGSMSSSAVQQTVSAATVVVGENHDRRATVVVTTPFRRSQFASLSWSEKRGRLGRVTRRGRRRLSDPSQDDDIDVDAADRRQAPQTKSLSAFCRSDWKRQVSTPRSVDQRSVGPRWTVLKQMTSRERARRRREFVRLRCLRYGWEPFSVDELQTSSSTTTVQQAGWEHDVIDTGQTTCQTSDILAGCQSRESLPEIVVDHERPGVDGSTSPGEDADARTVTQMEISTQKTGDVSSPSNDYEYVLHKFHHEQRGRPGHASPASMTSTSLDVSQPSVAPDLQPYWIQTASLRYEQRTADANKPLRKLPSPASETVTALLARSTTSTEDDLRRPALDVAVRTSDTHADSVIQDRRMLTSSNAVDASRLSTQVSNKFTENFQHEIIYDRSRHTSSDTREGPPARHRDPAGNVLRSPVVVEEMKENVEPTHDKATSPIHWTGQLPASKVFTVTGCPRTADRGSHSALARELTSSLERRRPIIVLPEVEQAIEVDNLRRYWYVSERSVLSSQFRRAPPPPPRPSPVTSTTRQVTTLPRSNLSCEYRREYEMSQDDQVPAVVQLHSSRQDDDVPDAWPAADATSRLKSWSGRQVDNTAAGLNDAQLQQLDDARVRQPSQHADYNRGPSRMISPETDRDWSKLDSTAAGGAVPIDTDRSTLERKVPDGGMSVDGRTLPQTVCHVRVTVRHRTSLRPDQADYIQGAPVPALRRTGVPSKHSSPAGRRVTFSEPPPAVDQRRQIFAAPRYQHNNVGQAALDTLWHYHETYPSMDSRHVGQTLIKIDIPQPVLRASSRDSHLPETPSSGDEEEHERDDVIASPVDRLTTSQHSGEITRHRASYSPSDDDSDDDEEGQDDDDDGHGQQLQQGDMDDDADQSEETSLSIKQLVASFESMTSPYMRAPVKRNVQSDTNTARQSSNPR